MILMPGGVPNPEDFPDQLLLQVCIYIYIYMFMDLFYLYVFMHSRLFICNIVRFLPFNYC